MTTNSTWPQPSVYSAASSYPHCTRPACGYYPSPGAPTITKIEDSNVQEIHVP
ncbi:predicted protein [Botrytis cinerea T4]|uniref:Uncharacterized protein n=1 Tax=Botryotinia fuckeliana (strain T4) TaxID=999810 RepID=G2XT19_BOTF4|nr:predicted protein [Botrytis cinerea T4]